MNDQTEKVALITGASRGLGAALAETLAEHRYHIIALARTVGGLEELDDRIQAKGGQATLVPADVTDDAAIEQIVSSIAGRWGKLDLWCHTAIHAPPLAPVDHIDPKDLDKSLKINVRATSRLITHLAPGLKAAGGKAVFFADPVEPKSFHSTYGLTKAAQLRLAQSWAQEGDKTGCKVLILTPPPMPTALRARFYPGERREDLTPCLEAAAELFKQMSH